ncbi:DUF4232 domain-containing protein [Streptomyces sp. NPDC002580]|uniref:DUF4232 domain-containing protein n=1 Tax=Streptomyces sp. NPDC002580 TaxID=3364653 RepID=UPI003697DBEE
MIATRPKPGPRAPAGSAPQGADRTVAPRGAGSHGVVRVRATWLPPIVLALLVTTATAGCGLTAEIDREHDPERTSAPVPGPSATGADTPDPPRVEVPVPAITDPAVRVQQAHGCPASGLRLGTGPGDAAMGLRGMTLVLTNCGKRPYTVDGHPALAGVLDPQGATITGVRCVTGTDKVFMAPKDPGPHRFTLRPGESATAVLHWRMAAEEGAYLRVAPQKGQDVVTLRLPDPLDIGPDNILGTTAWAPQS